MVDLQYTEEQKQFRLKLREFFEKEVIPYADQWEEDHIVPRSVWNKIGEQGLLCPMVPKEYGGLGGDFRYAVICFEEMTKTHQGGLMLTLHNDVVVPYISSYATEEVKKKYLPGCVSGDCVTAVAMTEPGAGSDLSAMTTTAVEDGDEVIINGNKTFISNGILCDVVIVAAKDPEVENPHEAISLYVVDTNTPGFQRGEKFEKMGLHSQDTAELFFNNCRVPKKNLLGQKGGGFIILMEKLQQERLCAAAGAIAGADQMIQRAIEHCQNTIVNGKPLSKNQTVQFALVEMAADVKIGKSFIYNLVNDHIAGKNVVVETSMSKFWATDLSNQIISRCMDLFGDWGYMEKNLLARSFRDVKITTIFAGSNEIMKQICAKFMGL